MNNIRQFRRLLYWGEEGKKLFTFQRNDYLNSSPARDVEKKPLKWNFSEKMLILLHNVVAVVLRKNSQLSLHKAKLMFTACSLTEFTVLRKELL
jgi:hypothetical protein